MKPQSSQRFSPCSQKEILCFTQNDKYTACHAESFACCHSEGAEATEESQDRLREASLVFDTNERT